MSYNIFKTEDTVNNMKYYHVQVNDSRTMFVKASSTATQTDIDAVVDTQLAAEQAQLDMMAKEEADAAYAKEQGNV